jgi:hypothetical protein
MADPHLSPSELTRWRDEGAGDRDRIVGHLATCAVCRHLAADLERERPPEDAAARFHPQDFVPEGYRVGSRRMPGSALPRRLAYLAAAAAIVLAAVYLPPWLRDRSTSSLRGGDAPVVLVRPVDSTVPSQDLAFEWTAASGLDRLRLHVVAIDDPATPLIDREVSGTRYEPTADERRRLQPGKELHWFVEYRGGGTAAGTSPAARFRVR